jgi:hypothetical protein
MIKEFQDFATAHKQINEFGNGDLWEIVQHDSLLKDFNYPLLFVQDSPASIGDGFITNGFNAYFEKLYTDNWKFVSIEKSGSISSFTERFDDTLTGWTMSMQLKQPLEYNECQIPQT